MTLAVQDMSIKKPDMAEFLPTAKAVLISDEGVRAKPYLDTVGKCTIGVGRNLSDKGLGQEEIEFLFQNDLHEAMQGARKALGTNEFWSLSPVRKIVLTSMAFQMGEAGLKKFKNTLAKIRAEDFEGAAENMLKSKWAKQTPARAKRMSYMMKTNKLHPDYESA